MIGISNSIGAYRSFVDPAASAYFAATGITGATEQAAVNTLVTSLKSAGLWSKMKAVYPFVTDNRNLLGYTEDFSNAYWNKLRTTITANATTAPDGTLTADALFETAVTDFHGLENASAFTLVNGSTYTQSIYIKPIGRRYIALTTQWGGGTLGAWFDTDATSVFSQDAGITASISTASNGFYRITITRTSPTTSGYFNIWFDNSTPTAGVYFTGNTYLGDVTKGFYLWGAQLEPGSTATTYQPIATTQQSYISNQFKYNLVNPVDSDAAFRGVFNGGWTFSNQGATPNGTNGYANTKVFNNTHLTDRSSHWSAYLRTINTGDGYFGYFNGSNVFGLQQKSSLNKVQLGVNNLYQTLITSTTGFYIGKTDNTLGKVYINNSQTETSTANAISQTLEFLLGALNNSGATTFLFSQHQYGFASLGDKLSDTEATALYNAVQTFNTSLARQVA